MLRAPKCHRHEAGRRHPEGHEGAPAQQEPGPGKQADDGKERAWDAAQRQPAVDPVNAPVRNR